MPSSTHGVFTIGTAACLLLLIGCASYGPVHSRTDVETTVDMSVDDGHRAIRVFCTDSASVIEIDGSRFVFPGHRGYLGDLGTSSGNLTIGSIQFSYDDDHVRYRGEYGSGMVSLAVRPRLVIEQSGNAHDETALGR